MGRSGFRLVPRASGGQTYEPETKRSGVPVRYIFAVLGSIGFAIIYGLKVNLSVAIVVMVNQTATGGEQNENGTDTCPDPERDGNSTSDTQDGPYMWNAEIQGRILGAYFWGYMVTQLPGGRLAELFSGKWVMWVAVFVNALCCLVTPPASEFDDGIILMVVRVIQGLAAGVTFPAMHVMIANWTPPKERSRISSIVYAGTALGTVISLPMAGALAFSLGWESIFYVMGGLSMIWCFLWAFLVYESPNQHAFISPEERTYIVSSLGQKEGEKHRTPPVPWCAVLRSMPFHAILIAHFCSNFGWYMLLMELPTFMKQILRFDIQENAGLSALPFLCTWIFSILLSNRLDWARSKKYITTTTARKISTGLASAVPAACLVGVCFVGCDRDAAVGLMTVGSMFIGGMFSGFLSNHIDIAPNFAGTLMGITNTVATIPGFVVPELVGYLTHNNNTVGQWRILFLTTTALYVVELVAYLIFGSGEEQSWNRTPVKGSVDRGQHTHM